jgi:hypothetical protein
MLLSVIFAIINPCTYLGELLVQVWKAKLYHYLVIGLHPFF